MQNLREIFDKNNQCKYLQSKLIDLVKSMEVIT